MSLQYLLHTGWVIRHLRGSRCDTQTIRKIAGAHIGVSIVEIQPYGYPGENLRADRRIRTTSRSLTKTLPHPLFGGDRDITPG